MPSSHVVSTTKPSGSTHHACATGCPATHVLMASEVRGRLRTGMVPDNGFAIGFEDGLTAAEPVVHTVIHVVPRRAGDRNALPECSEWIDDVGVLA